MTVNACPGWRASASAIGTLNDCACRLCPCSLLPRLWVSRSHPSCWVPRELPSGSSAQFWNHRICWDRACPLSNGCKAQIGHLDFPLGPSESFTSSSIPDMASSWGVPNGHPRQSRQWNRQCRISKLTPRVDSESHDTSCPLPSSGAASCPRILPIILLSRRSLPEQSLRSICRNLSGTLCPSLVVSVHHHFASLCLSHGLMPPTSVSAISLQIPERPLAPTKVMV